ncbi:MAG: transcription initiation protein [Microcella sp.]|mgnify:CR=1 FL=1|uniref:YciI family protein n=1 Tax=Microcella sp. TaxID=1913979 RepID=UPI0027205424|nr:transcription initiation protein [Microcella sp.]MDO8337216.1 transcription initiation protein [Microcella sp.]
MTKYVISFPSGVMDVPDGEWQQVVDESHQVIRDIKAAGAYVFGGGINEEVEPVAVAADGAVSGPVYQPFDGGYTIIEVPTREAALHWAQRIAAACRCPQQVQEFMYDPES